MKLNRKQIIKIQKNRDPYLLIDYATKVVPGKSVEGYKILKKNEWFFKVHWEGDPNMPGMLQVEAMVQMSSLIIFTLPNMSGKILYLTNSNNIKFFKKIIPGDKLKIFSKLVSDKRGLYKFESEAYVKKKIACKAEFTLILPGLSVMRPNKQNN
ncbi:beta-hydroxyacyl-ACP dehydratase [Pelagibacteraceae bacterium]|jgi:3-hydroxyacyl-[acyl-carrier-protein] dehydratase|nr:beta-hydroxyacyl-ACP dehydratase [Pelagibacteraceae bacterium]|tara:strand:+ start:50 stop:511 length:462 start_codon:yes stop_codon:yes gene_type:complete